MNRIRSLVTAESESHAGGLAPGKTAGEIETRANELTSHSTPPSPEERHLRISRAAYLRAEARDFAPGAEIDDWLWAEREVGSE
jgi:hypothetical protein